MGNKVLIPLAESYLQQLEQLAQEIEYARLEFSDRLARYRQVDNPRTRVDLQSSVAHFEKYILPFAVYQRIEEKPYAEEAERLTLGIDGYWNAYEFRHMFEGIDYLNKVFTIRYKLERDSPDFRLRREKTRSPIYRKAQLYYYLSPREELRVREVQFASPGLVSFEGAGEVIRELRETFNYVITCLWLKNFIDTFWQITDSDTRRAEAEARREEAKARTYEARLRQVEAKSKIKIATEQIRERDQSRNIEPTVEKELGLKKIDELADTAIKLEANGLTQLSTVENSIVHSLSVLHGLTYEREKIKLSVPSEKE